MDTKNILYINQEIYPYVPKSEVSTFCRELPQSIQELGKEIRTFMPKYGSINERRNQLHEVIRLSGMNLIINDTDHPLIIKVASIQAARMQVYFIDNEDFFGRKATTRDDKGNEFEDNDERSIFFIRGVYETVKKLRWIPDLIHCNGWMSALAGLYLKKVYFDDPCFKDAKIVYSIFNDDFKHSFHETLPDKLALDGIKKEEMDALKNGVDYVTLSKLAIDYADGVIQSSKEINPELLKYIEEKKDTPFLSYQDEKDYSEHYNKFYDQIIGK